MPKAKIADHCGELLTIEMWPIDRPRPYRQNARKIPEKAVKKVAASLERFGFRQPVVCDKHDEIVIGHTRLKAAEYLGWDQVPVHVAHNLKPEEIRALRLADNRTHEETTWDERLLREEMGDLDDYFKDLDAWTGFDEDEIDKLLGRVVEAAPEADSRGGSFEILITCESEQQQAELLEQFQKQGITCKCLIA